MRNRVLHMALAAMLAGLLYAVKWQLSFIVGVELVSLLLCVFTVVMGLRMGLAIGLLFSTLTLMDGGAFGWSDWVILYYIDWTLLPLVCRRFLKGEASERRAAVLLGLFGLFFNIPSYPMKLWLFGKAFMLSYMLSDIPASIVHGASNFILALFLYRPLCRAARSAYARLPR
jgi:uncharacterized membrane-anchored protein YitT (DUF2179 family)